MNQLIVTVEDDATISELVEYNLKSEGYQVMTFNDGLSMFGAQEKFKGVSLFILDIMLPDMDGIEICRRLRRIHEFENVPIIMLTARGSEHDKVRAFERGADDYITKPFGVREFIARVNANIRRYSKQSLGSYSSDLGVTDRSIDLEDKKIVTNSGISINDDKHRVYKGNNIIELTNREYELLKFMMTNKGTAYSRDDLLAHVWGYEFAGETRTVDVHIRQLRRKIEDDDTNPKIIETVRGRGYRFADD